MRQVYQLFEFEYSPLTDHIPAGTLPGGIFSLHGAGESCTIKAKER